VPFECNLCSFRNVVGRDPDDTNVRDKFTLMAIRRVLLDVMWAREPDTVASNWSRSKRDFAMAVNNLSLDYRTILSVLGSPAVEDRMGMGVALTTVLTSLRPGKNATNVHTQDSDLVAQCLRRGGELLLQDCCGARPEEAVRLNGPYFWKVVRTFHAGHPPAHGHGSETE
jgi:hypothetical protein